LLLLLLVTEGIWTAYLILKAAHLTTPVASSDAAVVLGAAVWRDRPSPVFAARIDHALDLLASGQVQAIIFTGGLGGGDQSAESEVAARYALEHGAPPERLRCETTSHTTWGNLLAATAIVQQQKWQSATIVSDPLHIYRALLMAEDLKLNAQSGPTPYTRYRTWNSQLPFLLREIFFTNQYWLQRWSAEQEAALPDVGDGSCSFEP
jgi:uncharacterized SAM-binding protein YcdF (DUF218 family)